MKHKNAELALPKNQLNLAGEFRVCSELLKRGIFATVTYGNAKGVDIYAIGETRVAAVVEVKTSKSRRFVTGFYQKYVSETLPHPDFWVLFMLQPSTDGQFHEKFFVLTHLELAQIQAERNCPGEQLTWDECALRVKNGVDNVTVDQVKEHEDRWDKIVTFCNTVRSR